ncbi:MAG TPA: glycosyl hydrolase 53 family protein [Candidatus Acidoferrum sp.]|jgi:arabinogalactan endo-1,4-beta-galactosidase|nr:glycosyl hydrolase 53 family protein [Candidatus Acidoferrum sp.]
MHRLAPRYTIRIALTLAIACLIAGPSVAAPKSKSPNFLLGADVTALDAAGRAGRAPLTYQEDGRPNDEVTILMRHGWNAFRIRVFVAPVRNAPNNTLENAIPLAKQIKAAGAAFLLDIHFSDTWADPGHQEIPVAWRGMDIDALANQWEQYAHDTVKAFKDAGAMPDMVQVGNEITRGVAWPIAEIQAPGSNTSAGPQPYNDAEQWDHLIGLLKAGIRGVKSGAGNTPPRIAIHIDKGGRWDTTKWFFDHITAAHVQYDIIAQSFYPIWGHGTLDDLWTNMNNCAKRYHKDFLVAETGYGPSHVLNNDDMIWPITPEGRLQFMVDLVNTVKKAPRGIGVMYWAPERDAWNEDGTPGPTVFTLDNLNTLSKRPDSKVPTAIYP